MADNLWTPVPESSGWTPVVSETPEHTGFMAEYGRKMNPVTAVEGLRDIAAHPIEAAKGYGQQNIDLWNRAMESFHQGDYAGGAAHMLHYFANGIPGVGAALDEAGSKFASGDYEGGAADTAALATQIYGPGAVSKGLAVARAHPEYVPAAGAAIKQGVKGGVEPVTIGRYHLPVPASVAGAYAGKTVAGTPGAIVGGMAPIIRGASRGWKEAIEAAKPAPAAVAETAAGPSADLLENIAQGMVGKKYENLTAAERASVDKWAASVHQADNPTAAAAPHQPIDLTDRINQYYTYDRAPNDVGPVRSPLAQPAAAAPAAAEIPPSTAPRTPLRPPIGPRAPIGPPAPESAAAASPAPAAPEPAQAAATSAVDIARQLADELGVTEAPPKPEGPHPAAVANRIAKADKLANFLYSNGVPHADASASEQQFWNTAAQAAGLGERPVSSDTWAVTLDKLKTLEGDTPRPSLTAQPPAPVEQPAEQPPVTKQRTPRRKRQMPGAAAAAN